MSIRLNSDGGRSGLSGVSSSRWPKVVHGSSHNRMGLAGNLLGRLFPTAIHAGVHKILCRVRFACCRVVVDCSACQRETLVLPAADLDRYRFVLALSVAATILHCCTQGPDECCLCRRWLNHCRTGFLFPDRKAHAEMDQSAVAVRDPVVAGNLPSSGAMIKPLD